ncbi:hypothetical protein BC827DRAFT_1156027 [Russula dissimulans]|nr:hypothetical protein BC827DRAFT_1156027 [Russula dissimulans]
MSPLARWRIRLSCLSDSLGFWKMTKQASFPPLWASANCFIDFYHVTYIKPLDMFSDPSLAKIPASWPYADWLARKQYCDMVKFGIAMRRPVGKRVSEGKHNGGPHSGGKRWGSLSPPAILLGSINAKRRWYLYAAPGPTLAEIRRNMARLRSFWCGLTREPIVYECKVFKKL